MDEAQKNKSKASTNKYILNPYTAAHQVFAGDCQLFRALRQPLVASP